VVATTEEETVGVSNDKDDKDKDGHDNADDKANEAAVAVEWGDNECRRHQSI